MSKSSCRAKRAYDSEEEARVLSLPGTKVYRCNRCSKFHSTSNGGGDKKRKGKWGRK